MFVSIWNAQLSESEIKYYLSIYLSIMDTMINQLVRLPDGFKGDIFREKM